MELHEKKVRVRDSKELIFGEDWIIEKGVEKMSKNLRKYDVESRKMINQQVKFSYKFSNSEQMKNFDLDPTS